MNNGDVINRICFLPIKIPLSMRMNGNAGKMATLTVGRLKLLISESTRCQEMESNCNEISITPRMDIFNQIDSSPASSESMALLLDNRKASACSPAVKSLD